MSAAGPQWPPVARGTVLGRRGGGHGRATATNARQGWDERPWSAGPGAPMIEGMTVPVVEPEPDGSASTARQAGWAVTGGW